jgi:hypothetical protein
LRAALLQNAAAVAAPAGAATVCSGSAFCASGVVWGIRWRRSKAAGWRAPTLDSILCVAQIVKKIKKNLFTVLCAKHLSTDGLGRPEDLLWPRQESHRLRFLCEGGAGVRGFS